MTDLKKIIIDDKEIEVDGAMTLIQACELANVEVPRFCYHERLSIAGNCRMCLVEVVGGAETSIDVLDWAVGLYDRLGKAPLRLQTEIEGYIANRLQRVVSGRSRRYPNTQAVFHKLLQTELENLDGSAQHQTLRHG